MQKVLSFERVFEEAIFAYIFARADEDDFDIGLLLLVSLFSKNHFSVLRTPLASIFDDIRIVRHGDCRNKAPPNCRFIRCRLFKRFLDLFRFLDMRGACDEERVRARNAASSYRRGRAGGVGTRLI